MLSTIVLLLSGCGLSDDESVDATLPTEQAEEIPEAEMLIPADEAVLNMPSACRFFKGKHWVKPIALISTEELAFKRDGKLVRVARDQGVTPNGLNEGQQFYRGDGYHARTMGLPIKSNEGFGLNVQADDEENVLIGRYGDLRCAEEH